MLTALASDAARASRLSACVLVANDVPFEPPAGVELIRAPRGQEPAGLVAAACRHDAAILIAPETDGVLERRVGLVRTTSCRVVGPSAAFIALATDKQATAEALAAGGVPVPAGCSLAAGERPPAGFRLPMIRKHRSSTGCDAAAIIHEMSPAVEPADHPERIEAFLQGTPVGVSLLCGPGCVLPLPAVEQRIDHEPRPRYLGGRLPLPADLSLRSERLAVRALAAAAAASGDSGDPPTVAGWVGVDMILGQQADGRDDRVLEINPRVTTSVVGLTALAEGSLVEAMLAAAGGRMPWVSFRDTVHGDPLAFTAELGCLPGGGL